MSGLLISGPMCSRVMTSFPSCASLTAILSAFDNLKDRYNKLKKENRQLKLKMSQYESMPLTSKDHEHDAKIMPTPSGGSLTYPHLEDVSPTVQTIVSKINDQLIIIGHQLDSLLVDFDRIDPKDEIYKVQETVRTIIFPRLVSIRNKELESIYQKDQDAVAESSLRYIEKSDEGSLKSDQGEIVTDNLLKLQRLLKKQNIMLKNLTCFINDGGIENSFSVPPDGWSLVGKA